MPFVRAVLSAFANFFNFSGRANRRDFWSFFAFVILAWLGFLTLDLYYMAERLGFMPMEEGAPRWLSNAWLLFCAIPLASLAVRRVHDHGYSGWWALTVLPLAWWLIAKGKKEPNRYG